MHKSAIILLFIAILLGGIVLSVPLVAEPSESESQKEEMVLAKYHPQFVPHPRIPLMIEVPEDLWIIGYQELAPSGSILEVIDCR